ncbi:Endonuclease/Exonuclease/phosphatase family [Seminavis robusta]|uniref:Endonuclease/Exonuclease/phosphatase family n=1 Tax=Seminavis robusta TaxID=568900 RepID=A0A9N8H0N7_9STRA|nr:Endonuclease/Exonuclease/phosphatase family [Seminavis robusta]|eukprot:Sro4_g003510.1 Endonuclease/Exonuclease/phosphatase family (327) ;mRNA; r:174147-175127
MKRDNDDTLSTLGRKDPLEVDWLSQKLQKLPFPPKRQSKNNTFTIITWNIWFAPYEWELRLEALLSECLQQHPDVLCFQEVTTNVHRCMLNCQYLRSRYEPTELSLPHGYDCAIWIRKDSSRLEVNSTNTLPLESIYGRRGLLVDLEVASSSSRKKNDTPAKIRVVATHLESGRHMEMTRRKQLDALFSDMKETPCGNTKDIKPHVAFLVGDFNLDPSYAENEVVDANSTDLWKLLKPKNDPGYTEDTYQNQMRFEAHGKHKQVRYDRIVMMDLAEHSISQPMQAPPKYMCVPTAIERLGVEPFDSAKTIWPSDHFGLVAVLEMEG